MTSPAPCETGALVTLAVYPKPSISYDPGFNIKLEQNIILWNEMNEPKPQINFLVA